MSFKTKLKKGFKAGLEAIDDKLEKGWNEIKKEGMLKKKEKLEIKTALRKQKKKLLIKKGTQDLKDEIFGTKNKQKKEKSIWDR